MELQYVSGIRCGWWEMENEYISETNVKITTIEKTKELMKQMKRNEAD